MADEVLKKKVSDLESALLRSEKEKVRLQQELNLVKNSKVWRLAEIYRRFFYVRLPGWIPGVRGRLGPILRVWWRRVASDNPFLVRMGLVRTGYELWIRANEPDEAAMRDLALETARMEWQPEITVLFFAGDGRNGCLTASLESVAGQLYQKWRLLILLDDLASTEVRQLVARRCQQDQRMQLSSVPSAEREIIANQLLAASQGEFAVFLQHDELLAPDALLHMTRALNQKMDLDMVYSDHDRMTPEGRRFSPVFKPAWSPDTLLHGDCVDSLLMVRTSLFQKGGGLRQGYGGAMMYDLILRLSRLSSRVGHVPRILCHQRSSEGFILATSLYPCRDNKAALNSLEDFLVQQETAATVAPGLFPGSFRVRYAIVEKPPVTIVIPTRDQAALLKRCIDSVLEKTAWPDLRVLVVDNNSAEQETMEYFSHLEQDSRFHILPCAVPFNYSIINNYAVRHTDSPFLLFLNNDTEVIEPGWLEALMEHGQRPEVGAVGALLLYSDNSVQHAGIVMGLGGLAGHPGRFLPGNEPGYCGRILGVQNLSGVTAACLLTRRQVFDEIGGFEEELSHAYNDVDFCLKIREKGYRIIYTPHARLYHHESKSRGFDDTLEKQERFQREWRWITERWYGILADGDPFYNPNLTWGREDFSIRTDQVHLRTSVRVTDGRMR